MSSTFFKINSGQADGNATKAPGSPDPPSTNHLKLVRR